MNEARDIELLAGIALEDGGISLPVRTVFRKTVRITMRTPSTRSLIRISRKYLEMGVTPEEYDGYNFDQVARFHFLYGKEISRMVAHGIVRGPVLGRLLNRPVAWLLRELMTPPALAAAFSPKSMVSGIPFLSVFRKPRSFENAPFLSFTLKPEERS